MEDLQRLQGQWLFPIVCQGNFKPPVRADDHRLQISISSLLLNRAGSSRRRFFLRRYLEYLPVEKLPAAWPLKGHPEFHCVKGICPGAGYGKELPGPGLQLSLVQADIAELLPLKQHGIPYLLPSQAMDDLQPVDIQRFIGGVLNFQFKQKQSIPHPRGLHLSGAQHDGIGSVRLFPAGRKGQHQSRCENQGQNSFHNMSSLW